MQGAAHIMITLDIAINFWLTDSYLRAMKWNAWEIRLKNFMADKHISSGSPGRKYQGSVKDMVADSFPD